LAVALGFVLSQHAYVSIVVRPRETHPEQPTYQFDLAALSLRTGEMLLPASSLRPGTTLGDLRTHFDEAEGGNLWFSSDAPVYWMLPQGPVAELRDAWIEAIKDHPLQYLEHRARFSLGYLGLDKDAYAIFGPGTRPEQMGFTYMVGDDYFPGFRQWYERDVASNEFFGPFRQWMFVAVLALVGLSRRGRRSVAVRTLVLAGLGSTLSFMVAAASSGFRYAWFTMLCSLLTAAIGLSWVVEWFAARRSVIVEPASVPAGEGPHRNHGEPWQRAPDGQVEAGASSLSTDGTALGEELLRDRDR
jgi:hypothetical protein